MANKSNSYRIYDKASRTWIEIPEDQYREYDRKCTALRKRKQYNHECTCPRNKFWLCDGCCEDCEFHTSAAVSLDAPLSDGEGTMADYLQDDKPLPEEVVADRMLLASLIEKLREMDPDADTILRIWLDNPDGISDRKVADLLGRAPSTFRDQMKKFRTEARKIRGDKQ